MFTPTGIVAAVASAALFSAVDRADAAARWFYSPSGNISCQVIDGDSRRDSEAYCQSVARAHSVTMTPDGRLSICRGEKCLGNGPEDATLLAYGRSVRVGRFSCTSRRDGMRCRVLSTGRGFFISKDTIRRI